MYSTEAAVYQLQINENSTYLLSVDRFSVYHWYWFSRGNDIMFTLMLILEDTHIVIQFTGSENTNNFAIVDRVKMENMRGLLTFIRRSLITSKCKKAVHYHNSSNPNQLSPVTVTVVHCSTAQLFPRCNQINCF